MNSAPPSPTRWTGPWTESEAQEFLAHARIPMRLAANTDSGFPVILSLWFLAKEGELFAVVHRDARIVKRLRANSRCAFEISLNEAPYRGVRGQAVASIESQGASALLQRLLERYRISSDSTLGRFLLARAEEELVVRLRPWRVASWDYSERMKDALGR